MTPQGTNMVNFRLLQSTRAICWVVREQDRASDFYIPGAYGNPDHGLAMMVFTYRRPRESEDPLPPMFMATPDVAPASSNTNIRDYGSRRALASARLAGTTVEIKTAAGSAPPSADREKPRRRQSAAEMPAPSCPRAPLPCRAR